MASPAALPIIDATFPQLSERVALPAELSSPNIPGNKDASKRKRVNRIAKLKQCKLDARREQWLSQVSSKHNKLGQEARSEASCEGGKISNFGEVVHPNDAESLRLSSKDSEALDGASHTHLRIKRNEEHQLLDLKLDQCSLGVENGSSSPSASSCCTSDFSEADSSPKSRSGESPKSKVKKLGKNFGGGRGRDGHDFDKVNLDRGCDREEGKPDSAGNFGNGPGGQQALDLEDDDWEAAADALDLNFPAGRSEVIELPTSCSVQCMSPEVVLKPDTRKKPGLYGAMLRSASGRAWRPDDSCRPSSLPSLSKQQSLPGHFGIQQRQWPVAHKSPGNCLPSSPPQCPICTEVLDSTDSSFDPCSCGFQLCLFCHHRIASEDGRCPGCRKAYSITFSVKPPLSPSLR